MGPTHNDRQPNPAASSQPGLFDETSGPNEVKPGLSAEPNVPLRDPVNNLYARQHEDGPGPVLVATPVAAGEPIWVKRLKLVLFVLFCIELGMLLTVLPWTKVWNENSVLVSYPNLRAFFRLDFVRGTITGLGLIDIWLGIREAVNYKEK
jgi:hypothetical protein